ncbi:MAG: hypothetical protein KatS3mg101_0976 [Patescibacteria group bacterium]|nr:MAG: hypothetical protein KatS3mg101_0976 [Patescibacteria group bacterium]
MRKMKPKGKRGLAAVKRLGRTYKTGGFAKIAAKAAKKYGSKTIGKKVAGAIYQKMVRKYQERRKK